LTKIFSHTLWNEIGSRARRAKRRQAAIAYVSKDLLNLSKGDVLITDASAACVAAGLTNADLLQRLSTRGVSVYHCQGLHAKVARVDDYAVIGSANMSSSSERRLIEAGLITDQPSIVAGVASFIEQLRDQSELLGPNRLAALRQIKVVKRLPIGGRKTDTAVKPLGNRTWIVGVKELRAEPSSTEQGFIEKAAKQLDQQSEELDWIRWGVKGAFARDCREGDLLIQVWRSSKAKRPSRVMAATPVLLKQNNRNWTRFYLGDPLNAVELSFGQFKRHIARLGHSRAVKPNSAQLVESDSADAINRTWKSAHTS